MPSLISKEEAAKQIAHFQGAASCALCALCQGSGRYVLEETKHCVALLPQYARRWGHVMIVFREHVTTYQALSFEHWTEANILALKAAKAAEEALTPVRCYIASLGAAVEHPMTFPHLHVHMIPTYVETDTPSGILTTKDGVLVAEPREWDELYRRLKSIW